MGLRGENCGKREDREDREVRMHLPQSVPLAAAGQARLMTDNKYLWDGRGIRKADLKNDLSTKRI